MSRLRLGYVVAVIWTLGGLATGVITTVSAQGIEATDRPVARVDVVGLRLVPEQFVRNQIQMQPGEPYDPSIAEEDVRRLTHLGRFSEVISFVEPQDDGSVVVTYRVTEEPLLASVDVVGNKQLHDRELLNAVQLRAGDPASKYLIDRGRQRIIEAYEQQGYFVVDVTVDEELLSEQNILIYRVREGPRVRIKQFRFEGNHNFTDGQLKSQIRSKVYFPIFEKGVLSREQLDLDAGRIRRYYNERGYLDAQVGRRIEISPNEKDAVVTFLIEENRRFRVNEIRVEGNEVFSDTQVIALMTLKRGDVYNVSLESESVERIIDAYGRLGFLETHIGPDPNAPNRLIRLFHEDEPLVDVIVQIDEGVSAVVGTVSVRGNATTKSKVIYHQVRGMRPGRPFDRSGVDQTRRRLSESTLFDEAVVTILGDQEDEVRDVLIEVKEANTGSLSFGAGVSSDSGLIGAIDLVQRNFDIADTPDSFGEFITGRAFRGAGQFFALSLQPGNQVSNYSITFRDPYIFESDYFLDTSFRYFTREREDWDESRVGGTLGVGQRFGDVWRAAVVARYDLIDITDIDASAPVDVFAVEGDSTIGILGFTISRDTTDSFVQPSKGSISELTLDQAGALGGDYDFTRLNFHFQTFWTVDEDFLERKTILSWRVDVGYIFQEDAPVFERFYAGGARSFRGFEFRGVGPRGIRADTGTVGDDPVGGEWMLLTGLQYEFPLVQEIIRGVLFTDMGTVSDEVGFDEWRISIGTGVRIKIPFLSQAPFALDVAYPLLKEDGDQEQLVNFSIDIPIR